VAKAFLGKGWAFPVTVDATTGKIAMAVYEQDIKEAIRIILSTSKGERVMRPDFGSGLHDLVFASVSTAMIGLLESNVREALTTWEPRIELLRVEVAADEAYIGKLKVNIDYRVRETNREDNLVYPFYVREGL
jgi:phage baseplate assembly protein W